MSSTVVKKYYPPLLAKCQARRTAGMHNEWWYKQKLSQPKNFSKLLGVPSQFNAVSSTHRIVTGV